MAMNRPGRLGDRIIRRPRHRELLPEVVKSTRIRHPVRHFTPPFILFYGFGGLIVLGGFFLALPIANNLENGGFTPLEKAFFTATSAVTVTGLTVVPTATYWSSFGHAVIFALMLVGGLGFTSLATFFLIVLGQRITLPERMLMRDTMGVDRMGGLVAVLRNIVLIVLGIYAVGTAVIWWRLQGVLPADEALWHSAFLSVSSFNSAGFSILPNAGLPNAGSLENFFSNTPLLAFLAILIILGGIGWTVLVDLFRHRRFSRLSLDTKLVITTSLFLWVLGALVFFIAEYDNGKMGDFSVLQKGAQSAFHSVSGRTAGLSTLDFEHATDLTKLFYPLLMFVGGAAGSVAGGIKVATLAVIIAAVVSSVRGRTQAEAFGREIPHFQVHRAITVVMLGMALIFVISLALTFTERDKDISFLNLFFDTVSAFGTTGLSTGVPPKLSLAGKILFMITMFVGRLGPLTLALALTPREEATVYRFIQERVKIG